jgi:hypothetical protein
MNDAAWQIEHAVDVDVSVSSAWRWRTDVNNWEDPPARFQLDGPFASGSWGTTLIPGQEPWRWQVRDVRPGELFVIEMPLDDAVLAFEWSFHALSDQRTRMRQRIVLSGANAAAYLTQVCDSLGSNLVAGMNRIADAMTAAARRQLRQER